MATVQYNHAWIQWAATVLYNKARGIHALCIFAGGIAGFVAGSVAGRAYDAGTPTGIVLAVIGLAIGHYIGERRSFLLKMQAQLALCLVEIEKNSRPGGQGG